MEGRVADGLSTTTARLILTKVWVRECRDRAGYNERGRISRDLGLDVGYSNSFSKPSI